MFMDPKKILFESARDVVDYVSGGIIPPSRANFDQVMIKVRMPDGNHEDISNKIGKEVVIQEDVIPEGDRVVLDKVMRRVYENRIKNRNITIGMIGTILLGGIIFGFNKK